MTITQIVILLVIGLVAGFISGSLGVGGGIVVIPALVFFLGMNQKTAQGTNLAFMLLPIGIFAVMNYYKEGYVNVKYAAFILVSFVLGAYLGSLVSLGLPDQYLKKGFGALMLIAALKMILGK